MPVTDRPISAIITVMPAKVTAEPAVPVARPMASVTSVPRRSSVR